LNSSKEHKKEIADCGLKIEKSEDSKSAGFGVRNFKELKNGD
jgi:hypothetical protein